VADDDNLYEDDTSSNALHDVPGALVINVTSKAVAASNRARVSRPLPIALALYRRS
jgi:hypothetical protein